MNQQMKNKIDWHNNIWPIHTRPFFYLLDYIALEEIFQVGDWKKKNEKVSYMSYEVLLLLAALPNKSNTVFNLK